MKNLSQHFVQLTYYRWLIFSVTTIGTFMATLDSSIVNVALPTIVNVLGTSLPTAQWVVTAYLLTISSMLPLFGRLGDLFGTRRVYTIGLLIFTIGSVLCGAAWNIVLLVAFRIIQATGAAMLMSNGPAIVSSTFTGPERGRALGMVGAAVALGSMTGPSLGGALVASFGWRSIFYVNVPIGVIGMAMALLLLPRHEHRCRQPFDFFGASCFTIGMTSLLLVVSHGRDWGWLSWTTSSGVILAFVSFGLFIWRERCITYPMIDLRMFRIWPFTAGNLAGLFAFMAMFSNTMLLPFFLTGVIHLSPGQVGLVMTPFPLLMALVAPVSGYLSERMSSALLTSLGLLIVAAGLLQLAFLNESASIVHIAVIQGMMGLGNGMFQSPNNNSVMSAVANYQLGIAAGINALVRNVGMVTGTAMAVSVFESCRQSMLMLNPDQETLAFLTGYHVALMIGVCLAIAGAVVSVNRRGHGKYTGQESKRN